MQLTRSDPSDNALVLLDEPYERDHEYAAFVADFRAARDTLRQAVVGSADLRRALDDLDSAAALRASRAAEIIARTFAE